ncbi:MAG: hypothetical protein QM742_00500 [Aquabacterium sp.]
MQLKKMVQAGATVVLTMAGALAQAAPVQYAFTTGAATANLQNPLAMLWAGQASVSGTFTYNPEAPYYGNTADLGYGGHGAIYVYGITDLRGSVAGHTFSDAWGTVSISNAGNVPGMDPYGDTINVTADPSPKLGQNTVPSDLSRQLVGFEAEGYRLQNVRLFWLSSQLNGQQLVSNQDLPSTLPETLRGSLALDFVKVSDPTNLAGIPYYTHTVFFGGLDLVQVSSVPEASSSWMALLGVAAVVIRQRTRSRQG